MAVAALAVLRVVDTGADVAGCWLTFLSGASSHFFFPIFITPAVTKLFFA